MLLRNAPVCCFREKPVEDTNLIPCSPLLNLLLLLLTFERCLAMPFREKPVEYTKLIQAKDEQGIMDLLTDVAVEERVIQRVTLKAATFGQDIGVPGGPKTDGGWGQYISGGLLGGWGW